LHKWASSDWDALWMQPADRLLAEAKAAYSEHFQMIVQDLRSLPSAPPILVEGTALLPDLVRPFLRDKRRGLWMVPTETFQRQTYPGRGAWVQTILRQCHDPERALQNWMDRDVTFARWIVARVHALGLTLLQVDGTHTIAHNAQRVAEHFGLTE
jgi:hypothetical protein